MGMQRVERDEYPVAAVREMILNALVHRNYLGAQTQIRLYDDQFGVWNDGGLPEGITDVCFKGGYIDAWGRGTTKIVEACKEASLPTPILKEEQGGFVSKILKDRFNEDQLKKLGLVDRQIEAVMHAKKYGEITNAIYQELTGVSKSTATRDIQELEKKKLIRNTGTKGSSATYTLIVGSVGS